MKTCTNHSFIVVYQAEGCPVCALERELREAKREADRLPTGIQEALNSGDGVYRP